MTQELQDKWDAGTMHGSLPRNYANMLSLPPCHCSLQREARQLSSWSFEQRECALQEVLVHRGTKSAGLYC